jgi:hypothetical protein
VQKLNKENNKQNYIILKVTLQERRVIILQLLNFTQKQLKLCQIILKLYLTEDLHMIKLEILIKLSKTIQQQYQ